MAIWLNSDSKVIVQGMTGSEGMKHTTRMLASGTQIVGCVNPRKAGEVVDFPEGKTMGHAGAIVTGSAGTAEAKKVALEAAGVKVGKTPSETADLMREIMKTL